LTDNGILMSEYQYYEFLAIDQPLSEKEQAEVGSYSSRAEVSPTRAVFTYNYGDFRGDPRKILQINKNETPHLARPDEGPRNCSPPRRQNLIAGKSWKAKKLTRPESSGSMPWRSKSRK